RLLHLRARRTPCRIVIRVKAPRPPNGPRAEHERIAPLVEREVMRGGAIAVRAAVILELARHVVRRRREMNQTWRPRAVVDILIPLKTERALRQCRRRSGRERRNRGVAPEAHLAV